MKIGSQTNHDRKILSHIKWGSGLIFKQSRDIEKRFQNVSNAQDLVKRRPHTPGDRPIKYYRFEYPLDKREKDGITTKISHEVKIWSEKGIELIKKPGRSSWFDDIQITCDGHRFSNEEYFVLTITDRSRKLLRTLEDSNAKRSWFSEPYSYYETPSIKIILKEQPLKDSKERKTKTGREKIYPIKDYISSFRRRRGLIPIIIPKSLKEERWIKLARITPEIAFFREDPQRKKLHGPWEREDKPRWVLVDRSYNLMDFYIQVGIYSIQAGLLTDVDCLVKDFREYLSKKNPKRYPKDHAVLKKALQYIVNSYFLPYHSGTFDAYAIRTASGLLNRRTASYYQPKINPEKDPRKDIRQYIIKMRMQERGCSKETAKRWLSRKLKDYNLEDIYINRRYLN